MDFKAVTNEIKTILSSVTELQNVYGYYEPHSEGWPVAFLKPLSGSEERIDTIYNNTSVTFAIDVATRNHNDVDGMDALLDAVSAVMNELRKDDNDTLQGEAYAFDVSPDYSFEYDDTSEPVFYCRIQVRAREISAINL